MDIVKKCCTLIFLGVVVYVFNGCKLTEDIAEVDIIIDDNKTFSNITQTTKTAVILVMGQSNIANSGAKNELFEYTAKDNVLNFYDGKLYRAVSPLSRNKGHLATGENGSILPILGDLLLDKRRFDKIVFINIAVSGTTVDEWSPAYGKRYVRNDKYDRFVYETGIFERVGYAKKEMDKLGLKITHILWHQGESDNMYNTTKEEYKRGFLLLKDGMRELGLNAPIYMARASYMSAKEIPTAGYDEQIIAAQNELIDEEEDVIAGPNTDVLGDNYRYDFAHFNKEGMLRHALLWSKVLTAE